jgi:PAS domain S-box-containing protein
MSSARGQAPRAHEHLRRAEERFHDLVEAVTDYAIFMLDPDGSVATWNAGARRIKGYTDQEIVGQHFSVFYPPDDRAAGKPDRVLKTVANQGHYEEAGWRVRKDGSLFWANVVITALRDEDGALIGFAKVTRDLTERRAAEEKLRESEERFRLLVDNISDYALCMLDVEGRVTTWNRGAERMKGYTAEEIIGRDFALFFPTEEVERGKPALELAIARAQGRFEEEAWRLRRDGTQFWANVIVTPVIGADGELIGFAEITRDLTRERQAEALERSLIEEQAARVAAEQSERQIRESEQKSQLLTARAEEANRIKDEFLATVSHELRTPLNAIVGWAVLLRELPHDAQTARGLEVIHRNALAQARIIEDILDVSRIITGKLRLDLKPTNLNSIVNDAIEVVRPSADGKRISIQFVDHPDFAAVVGDQERLRQVVWNLLSNAVKFTDEGGKVEVSVEQLDSKLSIAVKDTGVGIEPEFLPYVFERFKQADSSTTRRYAGIGLGLAIVRHIVDLHGGHAEASSEGAGKGSEFRVVIPVRAVAQVPDSQDPRVEPSLRGTLPPGMSLAGLSLVVIDDEPDARELLRDALVAAGAVVEVAESVSTGMASIQRVRPDVVISDIGLPDQDGYSLIRALRALSIEEGGSVPAIALTAYTRPEDRRRALAAGFTTHIAKPVNPDELVFAIASLAAVTRHSSNPG